ncbi:amino acid racemase [Pseudolysobacter antarcticus]|uniref:Amino acid racemase n=1 Tax=Pseudolysobacter antarcticus TaxID=2511995 RepID=A0A411HPQ1_9GAMM|nr:amino acid racemase [Pseudolysobacter antarcticus]QBB72442.1 amino acid racemase [Pseudolysobacter antarcticus]
MIKKAHKKIGIIGGLSPESTVSYYSHITRSYVARFGDCGYPEIIIYSVNLEQYHAWRAQGRWDLIAKDLANIANKLKDAGADLGVIATNTMHKVFDQVQDGTDLPLLHILEPTIAEIRKAGLLRVGLLGTQFTMAEQFYKNHLSSAGISTVVPTLANQAIVHDIIVKELVRGIFTEQSRQSYLEIINQLVADGADGVILGCTEIPLLIDQKSCEVPLFDTATLHAEAALQAAISV